MALVPCSVVRMIVGHLAPVWNVSMAFAPTKNVVMIVFALMDILA
jgi:hypothetical protein